ncbi:hypothetical protein ES705_13944 [subsurface metagenome]
MKRVYLITISALIIGIRCLGQNYSGAIYDSESLEPLSGVEIKIPEEDISATSDEDGNFTLTSGTSSAKIISFELGGYMFEEKRDILPQSGMEIALRKKKQSAASERWNEYMLSCDNYTNVTIPNNPEWNVNFEETELLGDLSANSTYTRRDPSAVIKVGEKYYVWYTYLFIGTLNLFRNK